MSLAFLLLALAVAPASHSAPWVVIPQEPICALGTVFPGPVSFRLEYHPRNDSYHLLLGGPRWAKVADGQPMKVGVGTVYVDRTFSGRTVRQDPEMAGAIYVGLIQHDVQRARPLPYGTRSGGRLEPANKFIETLMTARSSLRITVDGIEVISARDIKSRKAMADLARCANQFHPTKRSAVTYRLQRAGVY